MKDKRVLLEVICSTLHYDSGRGGHSIESLLYVLRAMQIISANPPWHDRHWSENEVRIVIAELLADGALDLSASGLLFFPPDEPDPIVEYFRGDWYVTTEGQIVGPLKAEEARKYVSSKIPSDTSWVRERLSA